MRAMGDAEVRLSCVPPNKRHRWGPMMEFNDVRFRDCDNCVARMYENIKE